MAGSNPAKMLKDAAKAYKDGDKATARDLLLELVGIEEGNEKAWLLLSAVVDNLEDRQIALENVVTINPNNEKARRGLELIEQKLSQQRRQTDKKNTGWADIDVAGGSPAPKADPWGQQPDDHEDDEPSSFGDISFDAFAQEKSAKPVDPIPTSVDWGSTSNSEVSAHGSGKQVPQPSPDEYDNWIDNLNLKKDSPPAASSSSGSGWGDISSTELFSSESSSGLVSSGGWGDATDSAPEANDSGTVSPFGEFAGWDDVGEANISGSSWGSVDDESPFGSTPSGKPAPGANTASSSNAYDDDPFADEEAYEEEAVSYQPVRQAPESPFADGRSPFDDDEDPFEDEEPYFEPVAPAKPSKAKAAKASAPVVDYENNPNAAYLKLIPGEIKATGGGSFIGSFGGDFKLMASVLGLAVLNVVALGFLVMQLLG